MVAEILSVTGVLVGAAGLFISLYERSNRKKHIDAAVSSLRSEHQSAKASHEANLRSVESSLRQEIQTKALKDVIIRHKS